jgi:hypothetical protein
MSATPIFGDEDEVTGALVVVADIHGEKRDRSLKTIWRPSRNGCWRCRMPTIS